MTAVSALWLLGEWALRAAALATVTGAALWVLRVRGASTRLTVWTLVVYGALLIPPAGQLAPKVAVPITRSATVETHLPVQPARAAFRDEAISMAPDLEDARTRPQVPPASQPTLWRTLSWSSVALGIWAFGAALGLCRLAGGLWLGRKLVRSSRKISRGLRESADVTVPVTLGLFRPVMLLPSDWREWPSWKLDAVKAHEGAHIERRDLLHQLAASIYRALCWFHPLAWWLHARLRALAEEASDDAALRQLPDRNLYAEALLDFFGRVPRRVAWEGVAMARHGAATRRIDRILGWNGGLVRPLTRAGIFALSAAALPIVYLAASTTLVSAVETKARPGEPPVLLAQKLAEQTAPLAPPLAQAQRPNSTAQHAPAARQTAFSQASAPPPAPVFEVASIRPSSFEWDMQDLTHSLLAYLPRIRPPEVRVTGRSLDSLVQMAYGVKYDRIDCDDRFRHARFDIEAKMPEGASYDQYPQMLQALLADRFKLVVRREVRPVAVYELVTSQQGPALRQVATDTGGDGNRASMAGVDRVPPIFCPLERRCGGLECSMVSMPGLAEVLSVSITARRAGLDAPVVDATGLKGKYAFTLDFDQVAAPTPSQEPMDCQPPQKTIYSGLNDLGLKLAPEKKTQMWEFLVIESALTVPTPD